MRREVSGGALNKPTYHQAKKADCAKTWAVPAKSTLARGCGIVVQERK